MTDVEIPVGSRDGRGAGDHDLPYSFGHPQTCLTTIQLGWLTIMRGYVLDARRGEPVHGLTADDDLKGEPWP